MKIASKKGLGFGVIVAAVIAMVILVIIVYMVIRSGQQLSGGLESCTGKGGNCYEESCSILDMPEVQNTDCGKINADKPYCCQKIGT